MQQPPLLRVENHALSAAPLSPYLSCGGDRVRFTTLSADTVASEPPTFHLPAALQKSGEKNKYHFCNIGVMDNFKKFAIIKTPLRNGAKWHDLQVKSTKCHYYSSVTFPTCS
jgi:hypothetical protein